MIVANNEHRLYPLLRHNASNNLYTVKEKRNKSLKQEGFSLERVTAYYGRVKLGLEAASCRNPWKKYRLIISVTSPQNKGKPTLKKPL
ncbi:hypothetical protein J6590_067155 [Homalodisca vitripennis]|nr:hypothetical protein J6590_067155 [Homalodisca vitripennis]